LDKVNIKYHRKENTGFKKCVSITVVGINTDKMPTNGRQIKIKKSMDNDCNFCTLFVVEDSLLRLWSSGETPRY